MNLAIIFICISYLLLINIISIYSVSIARILNARYSTGISFSQVNLTTSSACLCSCIDHPHCLSINVMKISDNIYYCELLATYPINSSQLKSSTTSNATIYTDRTLSSVYINNGTRLTNPKNLFLNNTNPWIPAFKLFTGNNQSFLWFNSCNLTTLTTIPKFPITQITSHWFSILISQWYQNLYIPNQVALAFIVSGTTVFDFVVFNSSQSDITTWFSISRLISTQQWAISQYKNTTPGQTYMKSVYTDSDCIRSFNCNFKYSTSGCTNDFYGFFFFYGGYRDLCISAVRNASQISLPSIYYTLTTAYANGNLNYFNVADGIMGFIR